MPRDQKGGLAALLHQVSEEPTAAQKSQEVQNVPNRISKASQISPEEAEEQITIRAQKRYLKVIDRYRLTMITRTGNVNFTKKDAFSDIMKFFEENAPFELLQLSEEG